MNTENTKPLIWDFVKLIVAVLLVAVAILCIVFRIPLYRHSHYPGAGNMLEICVAMTLLTPFLAGLWGDQAIRKSDCDIAKNKMVRNCLYVHRVSWIYLLIAILIFLSMQAYHIRIGNAFIKLIVMLISPWAAALLFLAMITMSTVMAFIIGKRFWLYQLTACCLLTAYILYFHLLFEVALTV